jgi:hypothetical protein
MKGNAMRISSIALLAALGTVAMTLPASAAPVVSGSTDARSAQPSLMQLAQISPRQINEARGGDFKKKKAKKKKGKR